MPIAAHFEATDARSGDAAATPRADRRRLLLETQGALETGVQTQVVLHNFSQSGVLLESRVDLEVGETIDIELPELSQDRAQARARVIWASGNLYGCALDTPIPAATLRAVELRSAVQTELGLGPAPAPAGPGAIGGESLGERLHRLRKLRGLTQGELANRLGVSKPTVWAWEQGRARPIEERIEAIAQALGVDVADLRPSRTVPGLTDLIARCREQIAAAVETTPDKVRIMIEL